MTNIPPNRTYGTYGKGLDPFSRNNEPKYYRIPDKDTIKPKPESPETKEIKDLIKKLELSNLGKTDVERLKQILNLLIKNNDVKFKDNSSGLDDYPKKPDVKNLNIDQLEKILNRPLTEAEKKGVENFLENGFPNNNQIIK